MSIVASSCHYSMDVMPQWGIQFQTHSVAQVLPPPRSYYVVSWVPRALPEVVKLIREIPSEEERCLINKHFELGMLVMRRCGVQNPEEIKCLLDGFREGTTRLSAKDSIPNPDEDSTTSQTSSKHYTSNASCNPVIERRKLLIFFNDHRASRPWVLCPAKHCIKSARTTGKVKGRVKIFQYDHRSSSVKVSKLFSDCLSEFMTRDQYVFATFCPQQKYTDHEIRWFDLSTHLASGDLGGDVIFKELVEDQDSKGSRVWPFDDYIIFSNSQSKIIAVFKKKQPLLVLQRQPWFNQYTGVGAYPFESSYDFNAYVPTVNSMSFLNSDIDTNGVSSEHLDVKSGSSNKLLENSVIQKSEKCIENYNDRYTKSNNKTAACPSKLNDLVVSFGKSNKFETEQSDLYSKSIIEENFMNYEPEWNSSNSVFNITNTSINNSSWLHTGKPNSDGSNISLLEQAEESENVLVRIMSRVLSRLEPAEDTNSLDYVVYNTPVTTTVTSDTKDQSFNFFQPDSPVKSSIANEVDNNSCFSIQSNHCISNNPGLKEIGDENWQSTTSTDNSHILENNENQLLACDYEQKYDYQINQKKQEQDIKKRRNFNIHFANQTVLYHDLIRQFLSRLAYGLDHPPSPQKRIPDTVKRVVTRIVSECIQEVNLALLTSSLQYNSDFYVSSENNPVHRAISPFHENVCPNSSDYVPQPEAEKNTYKFFSSYETQSSELCGQQNSQFSKFDRLLPSANEIYNHVNITPYYSQSSTDFDTFAQHILSSTENTLPNSSLGAPSQNQILTNYIQFSPSSNNTSNHLYDQNSKKDLSNLDEVTFDNSQSYKTQIFRTDSLKSSAKSIESQSETTNYNIYKKINDHNNAELANAEYSICEDVNIMVPFNSISETRQKKRQESTINQMDVFKKKKNKIKNVL